MFSSKFFKSFINIFKNLKFLRILNNFIKICKIYIHGLDRLSLQAYVPHPNENPGYAPGNSMIIRILFAQIKYSITLNSNNFLMITIWLNNKCLIIRVIALFLTMWDYKLGQSVHKRGLSPYWPSCAPQLHPHVTATGAQLRKARATRRASS